MKRVLVIFLIVPFCRSNGFAQIYPPENKAKLLFHVMVTRDSVSRFLYTYDIKNDMSSEEVCDEFTLYLVDQSLTNSRATIPSPKNKKWYIDGSGMGFISGTPASRFLDIPPENGLAPGESMTILFKSIGLPSITFHYARSFHPPLNEEELDSLYKLGYTNHQIFPDWKESYYKNQTVAPNTNLLDLSTTILLDTLISYKHQSVALGWIKDDKTHKQDCDEIMRGRDWYKMGDFKQYDRWQPDKSWDFDRDWNIGLVDVLDNRLAKAKAELRKKDSVAARRDLEIFVIEVELLNSVSGKLVGRKQASVMTSEAYALLKYNAEYLIDKLPEGRQRH